VVRSTWALPSAVRANVRIKAKLLLHFGRCRRRRYDRLDQHTGLFELVDTSSTPFSPWAASFP